MTRDEFKMISLGNYVLTRRGETIDQKNLEAYSEGAMFAWDQMNKKKIQEKTVTKLDGPGGNGAMELIEEYK